MAATSNGNSGGAARGHTGTGKGRKKGDALRGHRRGSRALRKGPRSGRDTDGNARIEASERILGDGIQYDKRGRIEVDMSALPALLNSGVPTRQHLLNALLPAGIGDGDVLVYFGGDLEVITPGADGDRITSAGAGIRPLYETPAADTHVIGCGVSRIGADISTGVKGYLEVPYDCTITRWTVVARQTGSIEFDVTLGAWASYPPSSTIVGTNAPAIVSDTNARNEGPLTLWGDTAISAGDVMGFSVTSCTGIQWAVCELTVQEVF